MKNEKKRTRQEKVMILFHFLFLLLFVSLCLNLPISLSSSLFLYLSPSSPFSSLPILFEPFLFDLQNFHIFSSYYLSFYRTQIHFASSSSSISFYFFYYPHSHPCPYIFPYSYLYLYLYPYPYPYLYPHLCLCFSGDLFTARACYSRAVQATPPQLSLQVLLDFAKMEAYLGDRNQAVKLFETAIKRFPTHDR